MDEQPRFSLVHRFVNGPVETASGLRWDIEAIYAGIEDGLRRCAARAPEGIASIAADGWAVDYVRLRPDGIAIDDPYCYRDTRTVAAEEAVHQRIDPQHLYAINGVQRQRLNTVYQLYADELASRLVEAPWINLPEYVLHRLGGRRVAEYTNATHTGLVDLKTKSWSREVFDILGLDIHLAPELAPAGTDIGSMQGPLASLAAFRNTRLIAPACHDTASAIAGIPSSDHDWAYISSGTWSLIGTLLDRPCNTPQAAEENFTNLGAANGGICFHKSVNGMWLIQQCMEAWAAQGTTWPLTTLIQEAEKLDPPDQRLDLDDDALLLPGSMPSRINAQRERKGLRAISETPESAPIVANLIFRSLASHYARALQGLKAATQKTIHRIYVVGGGSRNHLLNRYTEEGTGIPVWSGHVESSTIGNFAIQLALADVPGVGVTATEIAKWAGILADTICEEARS
jgi:rhamnulokinase